MVYLERQAMGWPNQLAVPPGFKAAWMRGHSVSSSSGSLVPGRQHRETGKCRVDHDLFVDRVSGGGQVALLATHLDNP